MIQNGLFQSSGIKEQCAKARITEQCCGPADMGQHTASAKNFAILQYFIVENEDFETCYITVKSGKEMGGFMTYPCAEMKLSNEFLQESHLVNLVVATEAKRKLNNERH